MMKSAVWPLVAPFVVFMLCLSAESYVPEQHYMTYPVKILAVVLVLAWFWRQLPPLAPRAVALSVIVGVVGVVLWVGLDPWAMKLDGWCERSWNSAMSSMGWTSWKTDVADAPPPGRDPFALYSAAVAWPLFAIRLAGISLVVPVMEELFWRAFLMRWLMKEDFTSVPIGAYQPASFWITTLLFAAVHGSEWPQALIVGVLYGAWFVRTKTLGDIILAHGVTNFLLALYCLFSGDWHFLSAAPSSEGH